MKNLILSSVLVLLASSAAQAQEAVQWKVSDGGNGHWYRLDPVHRTWLNARVAAEAKGGHLATIRDAQENSIVVSLTTTPPTGWNRSCWLGARQSAGSCEPLCGWRWVTDEPFEFTNWGEGEPNDVIGNEQFLHIWVTDRWNDTGENFLSESVIEWSADCNSDGIVDYGQILDGTFPDANGNGVPDCCDGGESCTPCPGDVVRDELVDGVDLAAVLGQWGTQGSGAFNADTDGSGLVDGGDLALVLGGWGPCPQ